MSAATAFYSMPLNVFVKDIKGTNLVYDSGGGGGYMVSSSPYTTTTSEFSENPVIYGGTIDGTVIGGNVPADGYFLSLQTGNELDGYTVTFYGDAPNSHVKWHPDTALLDVHGDLKVIGDTFLGNLKISGNTLTASNLDGDVIILPGGGRGGGRVSTDRFVHLLVNGGEKDAGIVIEHSTQRYNFLGERADNGYLTWIPDAQIVRDEITGERSVLGNPGGLEVGILKVLETIDADISGNAETVTGGVYRNDFIANSILKCDEFPGEPVPLYVPEGTLIGRLPGGRINALDANRVKELLSLNDDQRLPTIENVYLTDSATGILLDPAVDGSRLWVAETSEEKYQFRVAISAGAMNGQRKVVIAPRLNGRYVILSGAVVRDFIFRKDGESILLEWVQELGQWVLVADQCRDQSSTALSVSDIRYVELPDDDATYYAPIVYGSSGPAVFTITDMNNPDGASAVFIVAGNAKNGTGRGGHVVRTASFPGKNGEQLFMDWRSSTGQYPILRYDSMPYNDVRGIWNKYRVHALANHDSVHEYIELISGGDPITLASTPTSGSFLILVSDATENGGATGAFIVAGNSSFGGQVNKISATPGTLDGESLFVQWTRGSSGPEVSVMNGIDGRAYKYRIVVLF